MTTSSPVTTPNFILEIGGVTANSNYTLTTPFSEIVFAVMYNTVQTEIPLNIINKNNEVIEKFANKCYLNPYGIYPNDAYNCDIHGNMSMPDFLNLFYANNAGYFNVNSANGNNPAIMFSKQTYSAANSEYNRFSLTQVILRAYCCNNGLSVNDINPATRILVNKECNHFKSLSTLQGTVIAMNWGEVNETLLSQGSVDLSGNSVYTSSESIPLVLIVNFTSLVLKTTLQIKFTYYVKIQGYSVSLTSAAQTTYNGATVL